MAHTSDYSLIYATVNDGLSLAEIKTALGETSLNLDTLSLSSEINPKARCKPIRGISTEIITDADRLEQNYGHSYPTSFTDVHDMLSLWADMDAFFPYLKPLSHYRQLDFDGYRHNQGNWFEATPNRESVLRNSSFKIHVNYEELRQYIKAIASISEVTWYNRTFGFWVTDVPPSQIGTGTTHILGFYLAAGGNVGTIITDFDDGNIPVATTDSTLAPSGSDVPRYFIPAFTNWTSALYLTPTFIPTSAMGDAFSGRFWYLFPFCTITPITIVGTGGDDPILDAVSVEELTSSDYIIDSIDPRNLQYAFRYLRIIWKNSGATPATIVFSATIAACVSGTTITSGGSVSIPANGQATTVLIRNTPDDYHRFELIDTDITRIDITASTSGGTRTMQYRLNYTL